VKTRILLIDDHQMFRDGLKAFLEQTPRFQIAGAVGTVDEAIALLTREHDGGRSVGIVLLDIALGEANGISDIHRLQAAAPAIAIVMLSMYASTSLVRAALDAGAQGYVTKTSAGPEIIAALDAVSDGRRYIDRSLKLDVARSLSQGSSPSSFERYQRLSSREQQVFLELAGGAKPRQIAQKLGIAKRTADAHRYHILQKLEVENVAELVRLAVELGVIDRPPRETE
jgi:DNA-binding NarL/FixJ family response regulator